MSGSSTTNEKTTTTTTKKKDGDDELEILKLLFQNGKDDDDEEIEHPTYQRMKSLIVEKSPSSSYGVVHYDTGAEQLDHYASLKDAFDDKMDFDLKYIQENPDMYFRDEND